MHYRFHVGGHLVRGPVISAEAVDQTQGEAIGVYRTFFDLSSVLGPIIMTTEITCYSIKHYFYLAAALDF